MTDPVEPDAPTVDLARGRSRWPRSARSSSLPAAIVQNASLDGLEPPRPRPVRRDPRWPSASAAAVAGRRPGDRSSPTARCAALVGLRRRAGRRRRPAAWPGATTVHPVGHRRSPRCCPRSCGMIGGVLGHRLAAPPARDDGSPDASHCQTDQGELTVSILVIDVGTSGVRAAVVRPDATVAVEHHRETLPDSPAPGLVEFDAAVLADAAARAAPAGAGRGRSGRRPSASPTSGRRRSCGTAPPASPVGPALGWQDLRTVGDCLVLQAEGLRLAPNQSATKVALPARHADPDRARDLCFGTVDTWIAWHLSGGALHVTDLTNAARHRPASTATARGWDDRGARALAHPARRCCRPIVDSTGVLGPATALDGAPPIAGIAGDQQASLHRPGRASRPGLAKITFGTGGMLDVVLGPDRPALRDPGRRRHLPDRRLAPRRRAHLGRRGGHAVGRHQRRVAARRPRPHRRPAPSPTTWRSQCETTDGVVYVPALLGLGTPRVGLRRPRHAARPHPGHRTARRSCGPCSRASPSAAPTSSRRPRPTPARPIAALRVDGGMSRNPTFVQALADATQRPVEVSPGGRGHDARRRVPRRPGRRHLGRRSTTSPPPGRPPRSVEPGAPLDRDRWADAVDRATQWFPELSGLDF